MHNLRTVLEMVRLYGPISRAETARRTRLTAQTVSNLVTVLLEQGLLLESGHRQGPRGRSSTLLELAADGAYSIGLDLDRGHLTGLLVDLSGKVRQRVHRELSFPNPEVALDLMASTVAELAGTVDARRVWGVGVGFPGPLRIGEGVVDNIINPEGFPGWENVSVRELLGARVPFDVFLENNATAAAMGESYYGVGRALESFFYVFLGVGLGGAIIREGTPFRGWQGNAGEIGFMPTLPLAGGDYLGRHFDLFKLSERLRAEGSETTTHSQLAQRMAEGNATVLDWLERAADGLAPMLVAAEYLLDPQAIIVGGPWHDDVKRSLVDGVQQRLPQLRSQLMPSHSRLLMAELGSDAVARGVATLPLHEVLAPFPTAQDDQSDRRSSPSDHRLVATR
ncbi:MAG TPA: ROK family transcriptional regulator [Trueperaceae bacterium]|nr:ROK family transcriptional regulator [Trueperaceae bacterium]